MTAITGNAFKMVPFGGQTLHRNSDEMGHEIVARKPIALRSPTTKGPEHAQLQ